MIYKTTIKNLFFSFALVMDKNDGKRDNRAIAIALEELKSHLISLNNMGFSFITKYDFLELLEYFYKNSLNPKIQKMQKDKFWRKYFRFLIKHKKITFTNKIHKNSKDEIIIISIFSGFLII